MRNLYGVKILGLGMILIFFLCQNNDAMAQLDSNPCIVPTLEDYTTSSMLPSQTNTTLQNGIIPQVQNNHAQLISPVPQGKVISMHIVLHLRNQDQFTKCLGSINDPKSPNYRHFLNDTTIMPYLPTRSERSSIASYLADHGFQVENSTSQLVLKISAPIHVIENTFGVNMKVYQMPVKSGIDSSVNIKKFIHASKYGGFFYATDSMPHL
ncbi:MAG: protease pro-enzyme activation domain-containing protein, partial [Nitrosotalea sp.]